MYPFPKSNTVEEMVESLKDLGMFGMAEALETMKQAPDRFDGSSWQDRLAWMIRCQEERNFRDWLPANLKKAKLRYPQASIGDHEDRVPEWFLIDLYSGIWPMTNA